MILPESLFIHQFFAVIDNTQNLRDSKNSKPSSYYHLDFLYTSVWVQIKMPNVHSLYFAAIPILFYSREECKWVNSSSLSWSLLEIRQKSEKKETKGYKFNMLEDFCRWLLRKKGMGRKMEALEYPLGPHFWAHKYA